MMVGVLKQLCFLPMAEALGSRLLHVLRRERSDPQQSTAQTSGHKSPVSQCRTSLFGSIV